VDQGAGRMLAWPRKSDMMSCLQSCHVLVSRYASMVRIWGGFMMPISLRPVGMFFCALVAFSAASNAQGHKPKTDAEHIANAMSAGPPAISREATIMAMDGDKMRTIRKGKNEFTCISDDPGSPGNDPMCLDKNAMEWLMAFLDHKDAPKGKMGLVYMLQGGSDASNYDPFATAPKPGEKWVTTGPHVMVVGMAGMLEDLPKSPAEPKKPFIMWSGTSYEHIMMPVR
jgi:hypothetical protein